MHLLWDECFHLPFPNSYVEWSLSPHPPMWWYKEMGLGEVIRVGCSHKDGALILGSVPLQVEITENFFSPWMHKKSSCEQDGSYLQVKKAEEAFKWNLSFATSILDLQPQELYEINVCSLSHLPIAEFVSFLPPTQHYWVFFQWKVTCFYQAHPSWGLSNFPGGYSLFDFLFNID